MHMKSILRVNISLSRSIDFPLADAFQNRNNFGSALILLGDGSHIVIPLGDGLCLTLNNRMVTIKTHVIENFECRVIAMLQV